MPSIDKLLNKVNQATSAVKSLKGIKSKFEGQKYEGTYDKDMLASQKAKAEKLLDDRRASLQANLNASNIAKSVSKKSPVLKETDLQYPLSEDLDSFIIFQTRPRKARDGSNARNLFSGEETATIALYAPDTLSFDTKVTYEQESVGANARNLIDTFDGGGNGLQAFGSGLEEAFQGALSTMSNAATGGIKNFVQGKAKNPMEEQFFKGVEFRSHSFSYEFYPKSSDEARTVENIIWTFKTAMLPDTFGNAEADGAAESYFNYPNIFDIYYEGAIAQHMEDFLPCYLTDCTVSHSTKLFQDGYPVSTEMGLEFTELKVITQETYQQISKSDRKKNIGGGQSSLALGQDTYGKKIDGTGFFGSNIMREKTRDSSSQLSRPKQPGGKG
jgi:hypothetical protein